MLAWLTSLFSTWLGGPLGWFVGLFVNFLWGKAETAIKVAEKDKANHESAVQQAAQDNEKSSHINEASTSDEIDAAIDDSLKHL